MSKIVPSKRIGIPVPAELPLDAKSLNVYYGPQGFTPSYEQGSRLSVSIFELERVTEDSKEYFVFDSSGLPPMAEGSYDFYFTISDDDGNEPDFSPMVSVPLDREPPARLGQPVLLD